MLIAWISQGKVYLHDGIFLFLFSRFPPHDYEIITFPGWLIEIT